MRLQQRGKLWKVMLDCLVMELLQDMMLQLLQAIVLQIIQTIVMQHLQVILQEHLMMNMVQDLLMLQFMEVELPGEAEGWEEGETTEDKEESRGLAGEDSGVDRCNPLGILKEKYISKGCKI